MQDRIERLRRDHHTLPAADAHSVAVARERGMPDDLLAFHEECDGAFLFEQSANSWDFQADERSWKWRLLPLDEMRPLTEILWIEEDSPLRSEMNSWYPVLDVCDGNYLAIDAGTAHRGQCLDIFHETAGLAGEHRIIATSFRELLDRLLDSGGAPFWLESGFDSPGYR